MSTQEKQHKPQQQQVKHHDPQISRRWMTYLAKHENSKEVFPHASILQIPQLGSHDAGTFGIHATSELAADLPEVLKKLPKFLNMTARRHIATWSKTQHLNLFQQLDRYGCRYFDLRVCPHFEVPSSEQQQKDQKKTDIKKSDSAPGSSNTPFTLWLTHGSFSLPLEAGLNQIVAFLESKKEFHHHPHHHDQKIQQKDTASASVGAEVVAESEAANEVNNVGREDHKNVVEGDNLEVFVLDLQRISGFSESRHYIKLAELIHQKLGKYLVPRQYDLSTPLKTLWENGWRVFFLAQPEGIEFLGKSLEIVAAGAEPSSPMASPKAPPPPLPADAAAASHVTPPPPPTPTMANANDDDEKEVDTNNLPETPTTNEEEKSSHLVALRADLLRLLHPRNALTIRSHWFNQRYKKDLLPKLELELIERSKTFCPERCQLHVLQAILTPTAGDMAVAFGTGGSGKESALADDGKDLHHSHFSDAEQKEYSKRHSILDFAKNINSDLITLWEDESRWNPLFESYKKNMKNRDDLEENIEDAFFVFKKVEDLARCRPFVVLPLSERRVRSGENVDEMNSNPTKGNSNKNNNNTKEDNTTNQQQQQQPVLPGFDPRNVFMIDFVEIGRSRKTGKNAFEVCFDMACRRFGVPLP